MLYSCHFGIFKVCFIFILFVIFFFFFKQKTAYDVRIIDWSSDVCSSDLLWMVTVLIDAVVRALVGSARDWEMLRICLFVVGLGFFGWFWTHGGQTLGMRVWRVRVRRDNGDSLNWVSAAVRYGGMLLVWGIVLTPLIMRLPHLRDEPRDEPATVVCGVLTLEIGRA